MNWSHNLTNGGLKNRVALFSSWLVLNKGLVISIAQLYNQSKLKSLFLTEWFQVGKPTMKFKFFTNSGWVYVKSKFFENAALSTFYFNIFLYRMKFVYLFLISTNSNRKTSRVGRLCVGYLIAEIEWYH